MKHIRIKSGGLYTNTCVEVDGEPADVTHVAWQCTTGEFATVTVTYQNVEVDIDSDLVEGVHVPLMRRQHTAKDCWCIRERQAETALEAWRALSDGICGVVGVTVRGVRGAGSTARY